MLDFLESWINEVNESYESARRSCSIFQKSFEGFYTTEFLNSSYFVVVDRLPKPDFPLIRQAGLGNFIDRNFDGITYKDTYYVLPRAAQDLGLHFHELVHVVQWRELSARSFIKRYIEEIQLFDYDNAPLEKMAYGLDASFRRGEAPFDVENHVLQHL